MEAIEVENLVKIYGKKNSAVHALKGVSFKVREGEIYGFLGPNGAGKTTTIKIIATILNPTSGSAYIYGKDVVKEKKEVAKLIGYMPENPGFYEDMSAIDNLKFYAGFYGIRGENFKKKAAEILQMVGLSPDVWKRKVKSYSHGMRKRLALAQCLIHDPPIVILDEPSGGLDPIGIYEFRKMIKKLKEDGKTVFLSSHILGEVEKICDTVGIINKGKIVAGGKLEDLIRIGGSIEVEVCLRGKVTIPKDLDFQWKDEKRGILKIYAKDDEISDIVRTLIDNGNEIYYVYPKYPTLEEIFMRFVGGGKG